MREDLFAVRRRSRWDQLETLLREAGRRGFGRLEIGRALELARTYRATTTDLAVAQARAYDADLIGYLNRLVARGHAYVYARSARGGWSRVARFLGQTFPREVRRSWRAIGLCAALFVVSGTIAFSTVRSRPAAVYALIPASEIPVVRKSLHDSNFAFDETRAPVMSSAIVTNNVQVAALAFAGGMLLGIPTLWVVLNNGLTIGALGALFGAKGFGLDFWATVAPHGVIELTAFQIAAGGGLLLAGAVVAPGRLRRIDALKANGRRAIALLFGVAAMLVVAGTIEGFVSPLRTAFAFRLALGAITGVLLIAYFGFAGRNAQGPGENA
ncbi:MAG: stage II sporulation protein M [Candidatus Baltobacteraceae bacterium]